MKKNKKENLLVKNLKDALSFLNAFFTATRLKRFLTAFVLAVFFVTSYGGVLQAHAENEDEKYINFITCSLRNRLTNQEDLTAIKAEVKDDSSNTILTAEDKICLWGMKYLPGTNLDAVAVFRIAQDLFEEIYGKNDEFLNKDLADDLEKNEEQFSPETLEAIEKKMGMGKMSPNAEFDLSLPVNENRSLRFIFEYFMTAQSEEEDIDNSGALFYSKLFLEDKEEEFYKLITTKTARLQSKISHFLNIFTAHWAPWDQVPYSNKNITYNLIVESLFANKPHSQKSFDRLSDLDYLFETYGMGIRAPGFQSASGKKSITTPQYSKIGGILRNASSTEEQKKVAKALSNTGGRIIMDIVLMSEILLSRNFGDDSKDLYSTKFLQREYFTILKGTLLENKPGFAPMVYNKDGLNFEHNGADIEDYFQDFRGLTKYKEPETIVFDTIKDTEKVHYSDDVSYPSNFTAPGCSESDKNCPKNMVKMADGYFNYIANQYKIEQITKKEQPRGIKYSDNKVHYYTFSDLYNKKIKKDDQSVCSAPERLENRSAIDILMEELKTHFFTSSHVSFPSNEILPDTPLVHNFWEYFVEPSKRHGIYSFNFIEAYRKIMERCWTTTNLDLAKRYIEITYDNGMKGRVLPFKTYYWDGSNEIPITYYAVIDASNHFVRQLSKDDIAKYIKNPDKTPANGNDIIHSLAYIEARGMNFEFAKAYNGYKYSWNWAVPFDTYNSVGLKNIVDQAERLNNITNDMFGYLYSDYIGLLGAGYSSNNPSYEDPTEAQAFKDKNYDLTGWQKTGVFVEDIGDFFRTMFMCDVKTSIEDAYGVGVLCTNYELSLKTDRLDQMQKDLFSYIAYQKAQIDGIKNTIQLMSLSEAQDANQMHIIESEILLLLSKISSVQLSVNSFLSEIIAVSGWIDAWRRDYMIAQIVFMIALTASGFGAGIAITKASSLMMRTISTLSKISSAVLKPLDLFGKALSGVGKALRVLKNPIIKYKALRVPGTGTFTEKMAQVVESKIAKLVEKKRVFEVEMKASMSAEKYTSKLAEMDAKINNTGNILKNIKGDMITETLAGTKFKKWNNYVDSKDVEKELIAYDQRLANAKSGYNDTFMIKNLDTGVNVMGEEAKALATEYKLALKMKDPKTFINLFPNEPLENAQIIEMSKKALVDDMPGIKSELYLIKEESLIDEIIVNRDGIAGVKTKLSDLMKQENPDFDAFFKSIEGTNDEALLKLSYAEHGGKDGLIQELKSTNQAKAHLNKLTESGAFEKLSPNELKIRLEQATQSNSQQLIKIQDKIDKIYEPVYKEFLSMPLSVETKILKDNYIVAKNVLDENKTIGQAITNSGIKNKASLLTEEEVNKVALALEKNATEANVQALAELRKYQQTSKALDIALAKTKTTDPTTLRSIKNAIMSRKGFAVFEGVVILDKINKMIRGYTYDCNRVLITDEELDSKVSEGTSMDEDVASSLQNIYGGNKPTWLNSINTLFAEVRSINSDLIPQVYQNFLLLKRFAMNVRTNNSGGNTDPKAELVFNTLKQNLMISFNNLAKQMVNLTIPKLDCNDGTNTTYKNPGNWKIDTIGTLNIGSFNPFAGGDTAKGTGEQIISRIIKIFMLFAGGLSVLAIVYAGLLYTYSQGEDDMISKAKGIWFHAILGLLLTMLSYFIVSVVEGIIYAF